MNVLNKLRYVRMFIRHGLYFYSKQTNPQLERERLSGEILRNTHSIEKGLSLEKIRKGFGIQKIEETKMLILRFIALKGSPNAIPLKMFVSALSAYLNYHDSINFADSNIQKAQQIFAELIKLISIPQQQMGGILYVKKPIYHTKQIENVKSLFYNRHSVREFGKEPINEQRFKLAIELAMRCPSACNRQCYRVHIVHKSAFSNLDNWMDGVGGFANDMDKMLIITGNISVYRLSEPYQHIVTATVFASYLTLSLEAYGIGCCFVQREVIPNKRWAILAKKLNIPVNEEIVCCLCIGSLKDEYKVPVSYRLPYDTIVSEIK